MVLAARTGGVLLIKFAPKCAQLQEAADGRPWRSGADCAARPPGRRGGGGEWNRRMRTDPGRKRPQVRVQKIDGSFHKILSMCYARNSMPNIQGVHGNSS